MNKYKFLIEIFFRLQNSGQVEDYDIENDIDYEWNGEYGKRSKIICINFSQVKDLLQAAVKIEKEASW